MPKQVKRVTYVDDGEHIALTVGSHGGGNYDLLVKYPHGWELRTNIPQREPGDYDAAGGNATWKEPAS